MAKITGGNEDRAKVKFRVIEFELEGGNTAVENSIRQLTNTLAVRSSSPNLPKTLSPKQPAVLSVGDIDAEESESADEAVLEHVEVAPSPGKPRPSRKVSAPEPIEVDLVSGEKSFKQFCEERGIGAGSNDSKNTWSQQYG